MVEHGPPEQPGRTSLPPAEEPSVRALVRPGAWALALVVAAVVVILSAESRRAPGAEPSAAAPDPFASSSSEGRTLLDRRVEIEVTEAPRAEAWRIHASVLSAREGAPLGTGWVVLDDRSSRLHFLDDTLGLVRSVGGRGDGPGELRRPVHLAVLGDTLVGVLDGPGRRIDLFSPEGTFVTRIATRVPGCPMGLSRDLVADPSGAFVLQGICGFFEPRWLATRVGLDGSSSRIASASLRAPGGLAPPIGRAVVAWRAGLWFAGPDGCLRILGGAPAGGVPAAVACLPEAPPVEVPDSLRDALRSGRSGRALVLPRTWPPIVSAAWSAEGPLLTLADTVQGGSRALLRRDGTLLVLRGPHIVTPGPGGLLLARDFLEGTGLRSIPWSDLMDGPR
jgi:hypothetical protein